MVAGDVFIEDHLKYMGALAGLDSSDHLFNFFAITSGEYRAAVSASVGNDVP